MTRRWLIPLVVVLTACSSSSETKSAQAARPSSSSNAALPQATAPVVRVAHQPPTGKDVIDAVIASGTVPLSVSSSCTNVGTERSDQTVGRYLAGFLAELASPDKKNWIETKVEPGRSAADESVSICTLTVRHEDGDDRWGWGVRFQVRSSDGLVLANSFRCVGAG